jgi:hypothetical protein
LLVLFLCQWELQICNSHPSFKFPVRWDIVFTDTVFSFITNMSCANNIKLYCYIILCKMCNAIILDKVSSWSNIQHPWVSVMINVWVTDIPNHLFIKNETFLLWNVWILYILIGSGAPHVKKYLNSYCWRYHWWNAQLRDFKGNLNQYQVSFCRLRIFFCRVWFPCISEQKWLWYNVCLTNGCMINQISSWIYTADMFISYFW